LLPLPVEAQPEPLAEQDFWTSVSPQSPDVPGAGAQPLAGQLAAVKLSQAASGYLRSTALLQFQSQDPPAPATV
jgi:hypothetical protein